MRAGPMREWLHILQPETKRNDFGEESVTYKEIRRVHAERVKMSGRRSEEVSEHFPDYSVQFRIRDAHPMADNWRVQHEGGYLYTVVAVEPNRELGMLTLICERVNE